jgi:hypothetical protein
MRWAENLTCTGERRDVYRVLMGKPEGKRQLGNSGADGRVILRWIFRKWNGGMDWIDVDRDRKRWRALVNAAMSIRAP